MSEYPDEDLNIIAEIPARGGSKGVPRKALQLLGDKPLIAYTIQSAMLIKGIKKVFVNTDDPEIQAVSRKFGAEVPFLRPEELARDDSNLSDSHIYARNWYAEYQSFAYDVVVVMSPTHPFRRRNLINDALNIAYADHQIYNIGSIAPIHGLVDNYFVKTDAGTERLRFPKVGKTGQLILYQSAFSFNIVFYCRPHLFDRRFPVILNEIEAIDIDNPEDLLLARQVVKEGLYPFGQENQNHSTAGN
jgi:CMP-N-acetylneuraminic acid synthetase